MVLSVLVVFASDEFVCGGRQWGSGVGALQVLQHVPHLH